MENPGPYPDSESLRRSNRWVLGMLLALMSLMATFGLLFALATVDLRRSRDPKPETGTETTRQLPR
jgi:hypothetical protein